MSTPHQPIYRRYQSEVERHDYVKDLFDRGAPYYDRIGKVSFLGSGGRYRRDALKKSGLKPGMKVIDVACGTGAVTRACLDLVGPQGEVLGVDPSEGMLKEARQGMEADFKVGRAEALPAGDGEYDFLSMGYALRHVEDLEVAFREYHRVLKEGGKLLILEISRPKSDFGLGLAKLYFRDVVPFLSKAVTGSTDAREMMEYYWETIEACVPPESILEALKAAGFKQVKRNPVLGVFSEYSAIKEGQ